MELYHSQKLVEKASKMYTTGDQLSNRLDYLDLNPDFLADIAPPPHKSFVFEVRRLKFSTELLWNGIRSIFCNKKNQD